MLIKDIETIQEIVNLTKSVDEAQLNSAIREAEEQFIIPAIGQAFYDELNAAYGPVSPNLDGPKTLVIAKIQKAIAWFAAIMWLPESMIKITGAGPQIAVDENMKTPFKWQMDKLEFKYLNSAFRALENLLAFLEAHKDDYPTWTGSTAFTESRENFIPNATSFNKYYHIDASRRMYVRLLPIMRKLEDFYIKPLLGDEYYEELKTVISVADPVEEDAFIIVYIRKILAPLSISVALDEGILDVGPDGVFVNCFNDGTRKKDAPAEMRIQNAADTARHDANGYIKQLTTYLNKNASEDLYETYFNSSAYTDPATPITFQNSTDRKFYFAG